MLNRRLLRSEKRTNFVKFAVVGISGVFVNIGCFTVLLNVGFNKYIASILAIEMSIISNFLFNNFWTFKNSDATTSIFVKGIKFNIVSLGSMGISYSTFIAMSWLLPLYPSQFHQCVGIAPAMIFNYLVNVFWTFSSRKRMLEKTQLEI